jgi:hypothetical protein
MSIQPTSLWFLQLLDELLAAAAGNLVAALGPEKINRCRRTAVAVEWINIFRKYYPRSDDVCSSFLLTNNKKKRGRANARFR